MAPHASGNTIAFSSKPGLSPKTPTPTPSQTNVEKTTPSALMPQESTPPPPLDFTAFSNTIAYTPGHPVSDSRCQNPTSHSSPCPSTLEPGPPVVNATRTDVEIAVAAAGRAYEDWGRATAYEERREQTRVFLAGLEREREGFLKCIIREGGKPVKYKIPSPLELKNYLQGLLPIGMQKIDIWSDELTPEFLLF